MEEEEEDEEQTEEEEERGGGERGPSCHAHLTEAKIMTTTDADESNVLVKQKSGGEDRFRFASFVSSGNK